MKVNGYGLRDHLRLLIPLFGLLTAVWAFRLILGVCGAPLWCSRVISVTGASAGSLLLAVLLMHVRRFGGYSNVVVASLLLNAWAQVLIVSAIIFSVLIGKENIYTAPEFSVPYDDPLHLRHIYGHLTFVIGAETLLGSAVGCLLLWMLRLLLPRRTENDKPVRN